MIDEEKAFAKKADELRILGYARRFRGPDGTQLFRNGERVWCSSSHLNAMEPETAEEVRMSPMSLDLEQARLT